MGRGGGRDRPRPWDSRRGVSTPGNLHAFLRSFLAFASQILYTRQKDTETAQKKEEQIDFRLAEAGREKM